MRTLLKYVALLVLLWIVLSILMMWPPIVTFDGSSPSACVNNLRAIEGLKEQWALENGHTSGDVATVDQLMKLSWASERFFHCPGGGVYSIQPIGTMPTCSLDGQYGPEPQRVLRGPFHWHYKIPPSAPHGFKPIVPIND